MRLPHLPVTFTVDELKPLAKWLSRQSLPYDDIELHDIVDQIIEVVEANELADESRSTVQGS